MANYSQTVVASAARTTTGNSGALIAPAKGAHFVLDITASAGTAPTLDVTIERYDVASGGYVAMPGAAFAQKNTTGTDDLTIYPGIAETANRSVSDVMSETYRIVWTIGGSGPSFTFSIGANYVL